MSNRIHPSESQIIQTSKPNKKSELVKECRICLEQAKSSLQLIEVCKCSGSVKYVHDLCIKKWIQSRLNQSPKDERQKMIKQGIPCQICKFNIIFGSQQRIRCKNCSEVKESIAQNNSTFCLILAIIILNIVGIASISYVLQSIIVKYQNKQIDIILPAVAASGIFLFFCFLCISIFLFIKTFALFKVDEISQVRTFKLVEISKIQTIKNILNQEKCPANSSFQELQA